MVELVHGVLQLAVQHPAVGDDNDRLENFLVPVVVQAGQPRNGVGFARARAVLDQVVVPRAAGPHVGQQLCHYVQLMVPREDHPLALHRAGLGVPVHLQVHIFVQDLQQAVFTEHRLPQVGRVVAVGVDGVALAAHLPGAVAALVEGQKIGVLPFQAGGHVNTAQVHRKVDQNPLPKGKDRVFAGAVQLILLDGIGRVLPGELAFQLHRRHRDTIDEQHHINTVFVVEGVVQLPGAVQDVGRILGLGGLIDFGFRLPEHRPELDAPVGEALPQNLQQAHHLHFPAKALHQLALTVGTIDFLKPLPRFGLAGTNEGDKGADVQGFPPVKVLGVSLLISTLCG